MFVYEDTYIDNFVTELWVIIMNLVRNYSIGFVIAGKVDGVVLF